MAEGHVGESRNRRSLSPGVVHGHQAVVAVLAFIVYVSVYANRKSFSNVKVLLAEEWSTFNRARFINRTKEPAEIWSNRSFFPGSNDASLKMFLGVFNSVFMVTYATFQYVGGFWGDRVNLHLFLPATLIGSSVMMVMCFCISEWIGIYSIPWYLAFWIVNAMCQGPVWPCILSIMNNWNAESKNRGLIFGIFSSSGSCGTVVGSLLVATFVSYGYDIGILVPAVLQICVAIMVLFGLIVSPHDIGLKLSDEKKRKETAAEQKVPLKQEVPNEPSKAVGFLEALSLPGVAIYALSYATLKLVYYAFFFWLPFYFNRRFHWSQAEAGKLSIWFDIGGIIGATVVGFLSDRLSRSGVIFVHLILSLPTIVIFNILPADKFVNACVLFIIGYFIFGCLGTISGAVTADLGRHPKLCGNKKAQATISGIMEGTGSSCAALGQLAVPLIEQRFGWSSVFYMLILCACLTTIGVGRMVFSDLKRWYNTRSR